LPALNLLPHLQPKPPPPPPPKPLPLKLPELPLLKLLPNKPLKKLRDKLLRRQLLIPVLQAYLILFSKTLEDKELLHLKLLL
jgi:hypothetical protein